MLVDKPTPVQQLDGSLKAENGVLHQHLLLPLRHVTLPLCMLGTLGMLSPCKELHPFLRPRPEQVTRALTTNTMKRLMECNQILESAMWLSKTAQSMSYT